MRRRNPAMYLAVLPLLAISAMAAPAPLTSVSPTLGHGFRLLYSLRFEEAEQEFGNLLHNVALPSF